MRPEESLSPGVFAASAEERGCVSAMLHEIDREAPPFWQEGEELWVPVGDGEIRVIHCGAESRGAARPVVFLPGFGVVPEGFQDFYRAVRGRAEMYYVETREKSSSRLHGPRPDMSLSRSIRDVEIVLASLREAGVGDFVLTAACWGATIVLEGLIEGRLHAPTVLLVDPAHELWFPKWLLRWVSPILPAAVVTALRPLIFQAMLGDMREPAQKERTRAFVWGADVRKWKRTAEAAREVELLGRLGSVPGEVLILNGTADKIHDPRIYPVMAREMPHGRFLFMPAGESDREKLFGVAARELCRVGAAQGLPPSLARFERDIR